MAIARSGRRPAPSSGEGGTPPRDRCLRTARSRQRRRWYDDVDARSSERSADPPKRGGRREEEEEERAPRPPPPPPPGRKMEAEVVAAREATGRMARRGIGGEAADRIIIFLVVRCARWSERITKKI